MATNGSNIESLIQQKVLEAATVVEEQLDSELNRLEHMKEDDLEAVRQRRVQQLKKLQEQKQEWRGKGHGEYSVITEEKEFFSVCKESENVVCHFFRESTWRCKIVDKHLKDLAAKHVETRFIKIDVEKCPFLVERLRIVVLPTVALVKNGKTVDFIVGFDDLGGTDEFSSEMLEWRIACGKVITYNGDLSQPPLAEKKPASKYLFQNQKKIIKGVEDSDDDSD